MSKQRKIALLFVVVLGLLSVFLFSAVSYYQVKRDTRASEVAGTVAEATEIATLTQQLISQTGGATLQAAQGVSEQQKTAISAVASKRKIAIEAQLKKNDLASINAVTSNLISPEQAAVIGSMVSDKTLVESYAPLTGELIRIEHAESDSPGFFIIDPKNPTARKQRIYIDEPGSLVSGTTITAQVATLGTNSITSRSRNMGFRILSATSPNLVTSSSKPKVGVFLIKLAGKTDMPVTQAEMQQRIAGAKPSVRSFYLENSYGKFDFDTQVFNWTQVSFPEGNCGDNRLDYDDMAEEELAKKGINTSSFKYRIYVINGCYGTQSWGTVGGSKGRIVLFGFSPQSLAVLAHEFGHNLGFNHACSSGSITTSCDPYNPYDPRQYGDWYNVMGGYLNVGSNALHISTPEKASVGWIASTQILQNPQTGNYVISSNEKNSTGYKYIQVNNPDISAPEQYYLEYKTPFGYDAIIPSYAPAMVQGARLIRWNGSNTAFTNLIQTNTGTVRDAALKDKQVLTIPDPKGKLAASKITQLSHTGENVTLKLEVPKTTTILKSWAVSSIRPFEDLSSNDYTGAVIGNYFFVINLPSSPGHGSPIFRAKINTTGLLGPWEKQVDAPPDALEDSKLVISNNPPVAILLNNYLRNGTYSMASVNKTAGTIGTWTPTKQLSTALSAFDATVVNNFLLLSGGVDQNFAPTNLIRVYKIEATGNLTKLTDQKLPELLYAHKLVANGNRVYLIGGRTKTETSNRVYTSVVDVTGKLSAWQQVQTLPYALQDVGATVIANNLVIAGGAYKFAYTKNVYSAKINANGTLSGWLRETDLQRPVGQLTVESALNNTFVVGFGSKDSLNSADFFASKFSPVILPTSTPTKTPTPSPIKTPTLGPGCTFRRVQCIKAPCPMIQVCPTRNLEKPVQKVTTSKFKVLPPSKE